MSMQSERPSDDIQWNLRIILPLMAVVFIAFLVIGMAIPVVPLYVSRKLGYGPVMVGVAVSCEFVAALFSRFWAGRYADTRGTKRTVIIGLVTGFGSGVFYLLSLWLFRLPMVAAMMLLLGRILLGGAESFIITGALTWGLSIVGPLHAGKVISWIGTAIWAAFAVGAPVGMALYDPFGFFAVALGTAVLPLATLCVVIPLKQRTVHRTSTVHSSISQILRAVWLPGTGLGLTAVGFGSITTFGALLFADRGWEATWLVFTSLSAAFILGRVVFGHIPDRIGGARSALISVFVEAAGLFLIWLASGPLLVFIGAAVTGLGYALVYPGFGLEAMHMTPSEDHGLAMGAYTAFLDLALGITGPSLGLVASWVGLEFIFLVAGISVLAAAWIALVLMRNGRRAPGAAG
ncbi:arabinose transporter [Desulfovibrio inopinatus]|uniref:arabinose transporter n=1 Tax=Desulfovibrio inopinatus TaxID=102109 RepID=UPI000411B997|nr:arabinose transporter [Desulfovibrio inopinatus]